MRTSVVALAIAVALGAQAWAAGELPRQRVGFATEDGVEIVGDYYRSSASGRSPVVVLLHMYRSDRGSWAPLAARLHGSGFSVLAIDLRGHGESTGPVSMGLRERVKQRDPRLFNDMHQDVAAACAWLSGQPDADLSQLGLVGASVGCSVALDYASRDRSVDAVVCMTPGEKYLGVDSVAHIRQVGKRVVLLLATEGERQACDVLGKVATDAEVAIVSKGVVHGTRMFGVVDGVEDRIVAFLDQHIRDRDGHPVAAAVHGDEYFAVGSQQDISLDPKERRLYSSVEEARARGLSGPDSPLNGKMIDTADADERPKTRLPAPGATERPESDSRED